MTRIITTIAEVRQIVRDWRAAGQTVGLVPTMGYLHEGHQSLIERSVADNDRTVVSVFVNPTQFGPNEDLESYPRDLEHDRALAEATGADVIFHPTPAEMYYPDRRTTVHVDELGSELCGKSRPIHFDGVCLVVSKLLNIVTPDRAYFGQKDAQQLLIVRRMVRDLSFGVEIVGCPIVREADGLAKSSRNTYLSPEERAAAVVLSRSLSAGRAVLEGGERRASAVRQAVLDVLAAEPLAAPEYVEVVDTDDVNPVEAVEGKVLVAIAVRIGSTRLIDNFFFTPAR
ncbi:MULTISPECIES: pantoate--beta-alanine ligase [unclassified Adlercreutzia]|uniref:pantoate--beta-alanine ligase n=1 Tax=unclassified Adlercreutzia TaxID=2636013 RepID=UPI0013EE3EAF|nr:MULTISPECIES: pantoate--beta-alanine ligase [unclassified Adlercreutzia]